MRWDSVTFGAVFWGVGILPLPGFPRSRPSLSSPFSLSSPHSASRGRVGDRGSGTHKAPAPLKRLQRGLAVAMAETEYEALRRQRIERNALMIQVSTPGGSLHSGA